MNKSLKETAKVFLYHFILLIPHFYEVKIFDTAKLKLRVLGKDDNSTNNLAYTVLWQVTFWSMMDCLYDDGPIRLKWSWISFKVGKNMWLRRNVFLWQEQYLLGLATDSILLSEPQFWVHRLHPNPSATDLFQPRGAGSPSIIYSEGTIALPDLAW